MTSLSSCWESLIGPRETFRVQELGHLPENSRQIRLNAKHGLEPARTVPHKSSAKTTKPQAWSTAECRLHEEFQSNIPEIVVKYQPDDITYTHCRRKERGTETGSALYRKLHAGPLGLRVKLDQLC